MLLMVTGSRTIDGAAAFGIVGGALAAAVSAHGVTEVLHGGARGVDAIAGHLAGRRGLRVQVMRADWQRHGRRAGMVRNADMVARVATAGGRVLAIWDGVSTGTAHAITAARRAGVPVEVVLVRSGPTLFDTDGERVHHVMIGDDAKKLTLKNGDAVSLTEIRHECYGGAVHAPDCERQTIDYIVSQYADVTRYTVTAARGNAELIDALGNRYFLDDLLSDARQTKCDDDSMTLEWVDRYGRRLVVVNEMIGAGRVPNVPRSCIGHMSAGNSLTRFDSCRFVAALSLIGEPIPETVAEDGKVHVDESALDRHVREKMDYITEHSRQPEVIDTAPRLVTFEDGTRRALTEAEICEPYPTILPTASDYWAQEVDDDLPGWGTSVDTGDEGYIAEGFQIAGDEQEQEDEADPCLNKDANAVLWLLIRGRIGTDHERRVSEFRPRRQIYTRQAREWVREWAAVEAAAVA